MTKQEIAKSFKGVESSYAIQAGREIRIIINPDVVSDDEAAVMAREVAKKIEETMQYPGQIESSYAIQAGREIRIIINPDVVSDDEAAVMAREVAKKIEETMQYPGQIKVTILRETRATEYAK